MSKQGLWTIGGLLFGFGWLAAGAATGKLTIYSFNPPDIEGRAVHFEQFKGKAMLIVNVASHSQYTPQYAGLEALYEKEKAAGLLVLAFPSNDFGNEEPADDTKIAAFCRDTYHVTFPMFSKSEVRGENMLPLFAYLTRDASDKWKGDVHWAFTKFVVDRSGELVGRFGADVAPDDPELLVAVEKALADKGHEKRPAEKKGGAPGEERRGEGSERRPDN